VVEHLAGPPPPGLSAVDARRLVKVSKYLSRHLRHDPARLGLELEPGGWVEVDALLEACAARSFALSEAELREVVARSDKQRFAFDPSGTRIRANQGHSVPVDLELPAVEPPELLFHGTGAGSVESIMREGLQRRGRHHVHLSGDPQTAMRVGGRHGRPVVLEVAAGRMAAAGHAFYVSANGVWLTEAVPPEFLRRAGEG
jgi:putative RNA 2'-phosphotransferase